MKWLLLFVVVAVIFYKMGHRRQQGAAKETRPAADRPSPSGPVAMLRCTHCGVHLPASEALPGRGGQFCSASHRAEHEARHGSGA